MISKDVTETPVESTIKYYPRLKDGQAEFLAPISNHAGLVPCLRPWRGKYNHVYLYISLHSQI